MKMRYLFNAHVILPLKLPEPIQNIKYKKNRLSQGQPVKFVLLREGRDPGGPFHILTLTGGEARACDERHRG